MNVDATIVIIADERYGDIYLYTYQAYLDGEPYTDVHECFPDDEINDSDIKSAIEIYDLSDEDDRNNFLIAHNIAHIKRINIDNVNQIINRYCNDEEQIDNELAGLPLNLAAPILKRQQFNTRLPVYTIGQVNALAKKRGMTKTQVLIMAIDMLYTS